MINRAIDQGLANGRRELASRYLKQARRAHEMYQNKQNYYTPSEGRNRMALPSFDEMLATVFTSFLLNDSGDPMMKARAWHNAPLELRQRVFTRDQFRQQLHAMAERMGINARAAFPDPPGEEADEEGEAGGDGTRQQPPASLDSQLGDSPDLINRPQDK